MDRPKMFFVHLYSTAFVGGLFSGVQGQYLWLSDQQEVSVPIDWWSNSLVPQPSGDDLCLAMSVTSELSAHNCLDPLRFVCQICELQRHNEYSKRKTNNNNSQQQQQQQQQHINDTNVFNNEISITSIKRTPTTAT